MAGIDLGWIGRRIQANDFNTVSNYLKQYTFNDPKVQQQVNEQIKKLQRYGGLINAAINAAGPQYREEASFYFQKLFGNIDPNNSYGKDFLGNINNIGNDDKKQAVFIDYTFDDDNSYKMFTDAFGENINTINNDTRQAGQFMKDGKHVVRVYKEQFNNGAFFGKITDALNQSKVENIVRDPMNVIGVTVPGYTSTSYDADGNVIKSQSGLFNEQDKANRSAKSADELIKSIMERLDKDTIPAEITVKGYMCKEERDINNMVMSGQLTTEQGNYGLKVIKNYYDRLLNGMSLTGYDVYATEINGETKNFKPIDSDLKSTYTSMIHAAIKENRVKYSAAAAGGRVGTKITINPKLDKDGNPLKNFHGELELFVPGLFQEDARDIMDQDPDAAVTVAHAEHMAFNHDYDLYNGGRLSNFTQDGGADYETKTSKVHLNNDQVVDMMRMNEYLRASIDNLENDKYTNNLNNEQVATLARDYATKIFYYFNSDYIDTTNEKALEQVNGTIDSFVETILNNVN